jgi:S1-C subfamily serine protease
MKGIQNSRRPLAMALALALCGAVAGYAVAHTGQGAGGLVHATLKIADPSEGASKTGFAPIAKQVLPNVVNISSSKVVRTPNQIGEGAQMDPFFSAVLRPRFREWPRCAERSA